MKDERGIYYFPYPTNHKVRVYIRRSPSHDIEFRLYDEAEPQVWERHPWLPHDVISQANALYQKERNEHADMLALYDRSLADQLLTEEERSR